LAGQGNLNTSGPKRIGQNFREKPDPKIYPKKAGGEILSAGKILGGGDPKKAPPIGPKRGGDSGGSPHFGKFLQKGLLRGPLSCASGGI